MGLHLTQEFTYETDSIDDFVIVLRMIIPVLHKPHVGYRAVDVVHVEDYGWRWDEYPSQSAAYFLAQHSNRLENSHRINQGANHLYSPVCRVTWFDYGTRTPTFNSLDAVIEATINIIQGTDLGQLFVRCGGKGAFEHAEGSVKPGYRMHMSPCIGDDLLISHCHIYLPK